MKRIKCAKCKGTGWIEPISGRLAAKRCAWCDGTGYRTVPNHPTEEAE